MLPDGWKEVELGSVVTHKKGCAFASNDFTNKGRRVIRISDTNATSIYDSDPIYLPEEKASHFTEYEVSEGDIIVTTVGSRPHMRASMVGKVIRIPKKEERSLLNQNLVRLSAKDSLIDKDFLYRSITTDRFLDYISTIVRGNANQVSITLPDIFAYKILLPTKSEQAKIVNIFDGWSDAIDSISNLIEIKQKQKKALMQRLLTGKHRFAEFEDDVSTEPLGIAIKEVTERNNGQIIQRVLSVTNHSGFVLPEEHFSRRVASADLSNYKIVRKGQFAYNPSRINVGSLAKLEQYDEGVLSPMYVVFEHSPSKLDAGYLWHWLNSGEAHKRIMSSTQGSVRDSVNFKTLASFKIKMPSIPEQQKIASVLNAADREIDLLTQKLEAYHEQKKGLMQQLLTGKKRVKIDQKEKAVA